MNNKIKKYLHAVATLNDYWKNRNSFYHKSIENFFTFVVPSGKNVLEIGCGTGGLLTKLNLKSGVGIDLNDNNIERANSKYSKDYPYIQFIAADAERMPNLSKKFDFIIMTDILGYLDDVQIFFKDLHQFGTDRSRLIITQYSKLWEPILKLGALLKLRMPFIDQNWVSSSDVENFLYLAKYEVVKKGSKLLLPVYIPIISNLFNKYLVNIFPFNHCALVNYIIARKQEQVTIVSSVSVIVPARNEAGMIEKIVRDIPEMGNKTEIIFVEGHSRDNTSAEIERVANKYGADKTIKYTTQDGTGKGDAVRKGFDMAHGDVLMIYDADMTVPVAELPKFYDAITEGRAEFINGSRLVYPMEKMSMRTINFIGNKFFSLMFTWLLGQRMKDTLCGTKVLWKKDYEDLKRNRKFFGNFDPFGDFDLLFGAAKLNLKILDLPVHYQERTYGTTNIQRWRHGWLLLKMVFFAMRKIKFI